LQLLPSVVKELSRSRSKDSFNSVPKYDNKEVWQKAQKLQDHIHVSYEDHFVFTNKRFFSLKYKTILQNQIEDYYKAYESSKTYHQLKNRCIFYIFDSALNSCDCPSFCRFAYCKHSLASQIYLKKMEVTLEYHLFYSE